MEVADDLRVSELGALTSPDLETLVPFASGFELVFDDLDELLLLLDLEEGLLLPNMDVVLLLLLDEDVLLLLVGATTFSFDDLVEVFSFVDLEELLSFPDFDEDFSLPELEVGLSFLAVTVAADVAVAGLGVAGKGIDRGESIPLDSALVVIPGVAGSGIDLGESILSKFAFLVGVDASGLLIFSESSGFVVDMFAGAAFFAVATLAASAPSCRIARFCAGVTAGTFSFGACACACVAMALGVGLATGAAGEAPKASLSSSYSFHSSTCSRSWKCDQSMLLSLLG